MDLCLIVDGIEPSNQRSSDSHNKPHYASNMSPLEPKYSCSFNWLSPPASPGSYACPISQTQAKGPDLFMSTAVPNQKVLPSPNISPNMSTFKPPPLHSSVLAPIVGADSEKSRAFNFRTLSRSRDPPEKQPKPTKQGSYSFYCENSVSFSQKQRAAAAVAKDNDRRKLLRNDQTECRHGKCCHNEHSKRAHPLPSPMSIEELNIPKAEIARFSQTAHDSKGLSVMKGKNTIDKTDKKHFIAHEISEHILVLDNVGANKNQLNMKTRRYMCQYCSRSFFRKSDLVRHIRIHLGIKPNICNICGKQFIQRSALTVHQRVHTGEKPFCCKVCNRAFSDSSSLARHRRIHTRSKEKQQTVEKHNI